MLKPKCHDKKLEVCWQTYNPVALWRHKHFAGFVITLCLHKACIDLIHSSSVRSPRTLDVRSEDTIHTHSQTHWHPVATWSHQSMFWYFGKWGETGEIGRTPQGEHVELQTDSNSSSGLNHWTLPPWCPILTSPSNQTTYSSIHYN